MANKTVTAPQRQVIRRCQQSVTWFLRNFGKLKHPSAGVMQFYPFSYQRLAIKAFRKNRLNIFRKCRQAGVSKIAGAFATWFAMFHAHKTILIVSRRNEDAMAFLRDHIAFVYEHLPQWMQDIWEPIKQNEHEIIFPNGSRIQSLTSHPDVLRSHASSLNIIDEAAFIQGMDIMWAGGWPCQKYGTLIQTDEGLIKLGDLALGGDPWKNHSIMVATDNGYQHSDKAYVSGRKPTTIIDTKLGFQIEGTNHHRLRVIDDNGDYVWRQLDEMCPGDYVVSVPGQFSGKRQVLKNGIELSPNFAEILGFYIGDGSLSRDRPKRFKIVFDPQDQATRDTIVDKFNALPLELDTRAYAESDFDTENLRLNSALFCEIMLDNKLDSKTKPQNAEIPNLILRSDQTVLCAFLRGLFDSDGWCYQSSTCLKLGLSTTSEVLAEQVQVALHALGIISRRYLVEPEQLPERNEIGRFSTEPYWRIDVWDANSKLKYRELIGFVTARKQAALDSFKGSIEHAEFDHPALVREFANAALSKMLGDSTFRQCTDHRKWNLYRVRRIGVIRLSLVRQLAIEFNLTDRLSKYVNQGFFFDNIVSIRSGMTDTFDISVPNNNTYLSNGIVSHNTLQHGGNVICISTTNGIGNWYWSTMTDAEAGINGFNPIVINWWDMDWSIEYRDPLSRDWRRIAPRDGIRETRTKDEVQKFGPYWSPWLQEQYNALQEQGEAWKFKQEILADFIGSGNTVLAPEVISHIGTTVEDPPQVVTGYQTYVHPVSGNVEEIDFTFDQPDEGLWVWKKPVVAIPEKRRGDQIVERGVPAHSYVMGVDIATGKGRDYSCIEIFDIDLMEQAAEFMARCLPRELIRFIDRIGRWYNCALAVVERNNGGDIVIDSLRYDVMYPRLWRRKDINDKPHPPKSLGRPRAIKVGQYGFATSTASKPTMNKFLIDFIREKEGEGYKIYSKRLLKQFQTYVRKRDRLGKDTGKTEAEEGAGNFDDLVMACGLALIGTQDAFKTDSGNLVPYGSNTNFKSQSGPVILSDQGVVSAQQQYIAEGGQHLLMPMTLAPDDLPEISAQRQLESFTFQLGGVPVGKQGPLVTPPKYYYDRKK